MLLLLIMVKEDTGYVDDSRLSTGHARSVVANK